MASSLTMESTMASVVNDEGFLQKGDFFADEMMGIISDLETKCSSLSLVEGKRVGDIQKRLDVLQEKIVAWDCDPFMIWDCDPEEASEYLNVVDEVRQFSESLESLQSEIMGNEYNEVVSRRARNILQMAMARLEKEFVHLLVLYQQTLEPDHMSSFRSAEDNSMGDLSSCSSFEVHPIAGRMQSESSIEMDEFVIDLIHPSAVSDLKCVMEMMLKSKYDEECCKAYISIRKEALYKSFSALCMERWSTDILQMDWGLLNSNIRRWSRAIKVFRCVCLTSERSLCDLILGDYSPSARNS
ncbi:putative exocyst complex component Exo70, cullin repeat-like-containing domain superfamily [Dioscorea sansibarensis]